MSKKNNIAYIKPREPSFLTKLKQEANYKEGPTVETKVSPLFHINYYYFELNNFMQFMKRERQLPIFFILEFIFLFLIKKKLESFTKIQLLN